MARSSRQLAQRYERLANEALKQKQKQQKQQQQQQQQQQHQKSNGTGRERGVAAFRVATGDAAGGSGAGSREDRRGRRVLVNVRIPPPRQLQPVKSAYGGLGVALPSVYIPLYDAAGVASGGAAAGGDGANSQEPGSAGRGRGKMLSISADAAENNLIIFMRKFTKVWECHVDGWSSSGRPYGASRRRQVQQGMEWKKRLDAKTGSASVAATHGADETRKRRRKHDASSGDGDGFLSHKAKVSLNHATAKRPPPSTELALTGSGPARRQIETAVNASKLAYEKMKERRRQQQQQQQRGRSNAR